MLKVLLEGISKRFQYEWVFRKIDFTLESGNTLAITGGNGSGKSTLLKCISGAVPISAGKITYSLFDRPVSESDWFSFLSIATPYMEVPEEFTLSELLDFHFKFKKPLKGITVKEIIDILYLSAHEFKPVGQFSSGMKQRVKLGLCFFSDVPLLLLDEPTSNLDKNGVDWYLKMVADYRMDRTMIVCSNEPREYGFCEQKLNMEDFK